MSEQPRNRVIVIGAGIAGLTAGRTLAHQGFSVKIFEAAERVGGRMTTDTIGDFIIDRGAQFLSTGYPRLLSLVRDLGLEKDLRPVSRWQGVVRNARVRRIRDNDPGSALFSGLLNFPGWARLTLLRRAGTFARSKLDLGDYSQWCEFDKENALRWSRRQLGPAASAYVIEPMLQGFYFQEIETTSRALAQVALAFGARSKRMLALQGGMARLPEALAAGLDVKLATPVVAMNVWQDTVIVATLGERFEADYVVMATTAPVARRLYHQAIDDERRLLEVMYSSNLNLALMTDADFALPGRLRNVYGVLVPRLERKHVAAIAIDANKNRDRVGSGHLLNVMLAGVSSQEMMKFPDDEILRSVLPEMEDYLPGIAARVAAKRIYRWPEAEPLSVPGRAINIRNYRERIQKGRSARIFLAGDYLSMPFTEGAAESGLWAAGAIQRQHSLRPKEGV